MYESGRRKRGVMTVIINTIPVNERCEYCDGWGTVGEIVNSAGFDRIFYTSVKCARCYGTGRKCHPNGMIDLMKAVQEESEE